MNKLNGVDKYMRNFAKALVESDYRTANALEVVFNMEVAIKRPVQKESWQELSYKDRAVHGKIVGQSEFPFLSVGAKLNKVDTYRKLRDQLEKSRLIKDKLKHASLQEQHRMTNSYEPIQEMLKELKSDPAFDLEYQVPSFPRLAKTHFVVNSEIETLIETAYGFRGINFDNVEQVYNAYYTGIPTVSETRNYLTEKGMSDSLATSLMHRYLTNVRAECEFYTLVDLFSDSKAKRALHRAQESEVITNYV